MTSYYHNIKEGEYTATVYTLIRDEKYKDVVSILTSQLSQYPTSRAALSLLAYSYYHMQDYVSASDCYEQLTQLYPQVDNYRLYYAQSLYKSNLLAESMKVACQLDEKKKGMHDKILKLQSAIKYGEDDVQSAKALVMQYKNDPDREINLACLEYKEGKYEQCLEILLKAMKVNGYQHQLAYSIALCCYKLNRHADALKHIADVIEKGINEHPELGIGMATEGMESRSVGNTISLHDSALIETFNLKAAIEYQLKNYLAAKDALTDMPPRSEEEIDHITLHNSALMNMEERPQEGFDKLQFLLLESIFPPETVANLLLLYAKYGYYSQLADVMAENTERAVKYLSEYEFLFLESIITKETSPAEAFVRFDAMVNSETEQLQRLTKQRNMPKRKLVQQQAEDIDLEKKTGEMPTQQPLIKRQKKKKECVGCEQRIAKNAKKVTNPATMKGFPAKTVQKKITKPVATKAKTKTVTKTIKKAKTATKAKSAKAKAATKKNAIATKKSKNDDLHNDFPYLFNHYYH